MAQIYARNAESLVALGMVRNAVEHWGGVYGQSLRASDSVARVNTVFSALSRSVRMILQSLILGLGAYYVLQGEMTGGMIFASSIIAGRVLQPFDQVIGSWRLLVETWRAGRRLKTPADIARKLDVDKFDHPEPKGELIVENLVYRLPAAKQGALPLIKNITFGVRPGQTVAIVGPSKAGKSTLARLIVGSIKPASGSIRIDGADISSWQFDTLGSHIGYLAQDVELFAGTIAQNISRFDPDATDQKVAEAAQRAQVEDLVLSLEDNYNTQIGGPAGVRLSGGERQRIALARAFYGNPKLIVLDEPNSSLDADGEAALSRAVLAAKDEKTTVLLITHRLSIAQQCDQVLALKDGTIDKYGPAQAVLAALRGVKPQVVPHPAPAAAANGAPAAASAQPQGGEQTAVTGSFAPISYVGKQN
jgi:ATP-binding cassette subfamily C protein